MNSLSWFLYAANIASNIATMGAVILIVGGLFGGIGVIIISCIAHFEESDLKPAAQTSRRLYAAIIVPTIILGIFLPDKETMYAIAASEVGERVIKNDKVQDIATDATKALQQWIKKQIEPDKKN